MNRKVSIILPYYNRKKFLQRTLDSFQSFYSNNQLLEVVIVDDCSNEENRIEDLVKQYDLNILLVRISKRTTINSCYTYNIGVRKSSGEILVLSSPETFHTTNMFEITNDFVKLTDKTYFQFSVFCLVREIKDIDKRKFYKNLGETGCSFGNRWGVWYSHSTIKPSCLNFLSALTRDTYYRLSGFDERFRYGIGFDDEEFKLRILRIVDKVIWFNEAVAIHINHPPAISLVSKRNLKLFQKNERLLLITQESIYKFNDDWGRL